MTRQRDVPLESFDPQMIDWLIEASASPVRLLPSDATQAQIWKRILRFRHLAVRMRELGHPFAGQVSAVIVRWDGDTGEIVLEPRDAGLDKFRVTRAADDTSAPDALPGPDPLQQLLKKE